MLGILYLLFYMFLQFVSVRVLRFLGLLEHTKPNRNRRARESGWCHCNPTSSALPVPSRKISSIGSGQFAGTRVFLPRISLKAIESAGLPFEMMRKQFPGKLSFALTINKSQGQTIPNVGIYLPDHVFSHGQLYVVLSRGVSASTTKVLVKKGELHGHEGVFTRNVVYKDILLPSNST